MNNGKHGYIYAKTGGFVKHIQEQTKTRMVIYLKFVENILNKGLHIYSSCAIIHSHKQT
jgi:hypothetical protein